MSYSIHFTGDAQEELREVVLHIQTYNPEKAEPFVDAIIDYFTDTLTEFPRSGRLYIRDIRKLTYKKHTAFYRVDEVNNHIVVIHVVDLTKPLEARSIEI